MRPSTSRLAHCIAGPSRIGRVQLPQVGHPAPARSTPLHLARDSLLRVHAPRIPPITAGPSRAFSTIAYRPPGSPSFRPPPRPLSPLRPSLAHSRPALRSPLLFPTRAYASERYSFPTMTRFPWWRPIHLLVWFIPIFTFYLGLWQLRRRKWKLALIDEIDAALHKDPIPLPSRVNEAVWPEFAFRRVLVKGHWAEDGPPLLLGPKTMLGIPGADLILPFVRTGPLPTDEATTILVNRGFITATRATAIREGREAASGLEGSHEYAEKQAALAEARDDLHREASGPEAGTGAGSRAVAGAGERSDVNGGLGRISLRPTGMSTFSEGESALDEDEVLLCMIPKRWRVGQGRWSPDNRPEENQWFWVDMKAMGAYVREKWAGLGGAERGGEGSALLAGSGAEAGTEAGRYGELQEVMLEAMDTDGLPPTLLMQNGVPVGRAGTVELRNMHSTYAATWFTLSAMTTVMMGMVVRRNRLKILPNAKMFGGRI